jgi:uncharacterized protein (TIGR04255 family)
MTESARMREGLARPPLPDYDKPPVVEVALGMQFRPPLAVDPMELAPLRDLWMPRYPKLGRQPPLPAVVEGQRVEPGIRVMLGADPPLQRQWFMSEDERDLVQLQQDRLIVNWRALDGAVPYPRYEHVRARFDEASLDLWDFIASRGKPEPVVEQAEANYINAIDPQDGPANLEAVFSWWGDSLADHHLFRPTEVSLAMVFDVPKLGTPPVRMYVNVQPADGADGRRVLFMTITVRGAPADTTRDGALAFIDEARQHIVNSFTEMTTETMHELWGRRA